MMKRRLEMGCWAGMSSLWSMDRAFCPIMCRVLRIAYSVRRELFGAGCDLGGGFVPGTAEPVGDEGNFLVGQRLVDAKGGHAVVVLAIKFFVSVVVDEADKPPS